MSSLGFKSNGGGGSLDLIPICKFDARAGRFSRVDRVQGPNGWESQVEDITSKFRACFDLENIEIGWINFTGGAPDFQMYPMGEDHGSAPTPNHKEGFRILIKLSKDCGGDVRELCSTAGVVKGALGTLYDAYTTHKNHGHLLPVVVLKSTRPVVSGSGTQKSTNYEPVLEIVDWAPRPPDLVFKPRAKGIVPSVSLRPSPPATGSTASAAEFG